MAKNNKKISVADFESVLLKENTISEILEGSNGVTIQITKTLPLDDMIVFVQEVVEACVDGETGEYLPEAYDFAMRVAILTHYANFTMPNNLQKQYMLVYNTHAVDQVFEHINTRQFDDIVRAIDKKISFMLQVISSSAVTKVNEIINKFGDIATAGEAAFGGISPEDMSNVLQGISRLRNMSQKDLAKAMLEANRKGK